MRVVRNVFLNDFLTRFLLPAVLVLTVVAMAYHYETRAELEQFNSQTLSRMEQSGRLITDRLAAIRRDLIFLANDQRLQRLIVNGDVRYLTEVQLFWQEFSRNRQIYDQIRWIDQQGMERIRVDNRAGLVRLVPADELQDKSGRYYFQISKRLDPFEVYTSPLDLNRENGVLEQPYRPTLRLASPVVNRAGQHQGIVILNFKAGMLLDAIAHQAGPQTWLLNPEGYWLLSDVAEDTWGFVLDRPEQAFPQRYPAAWQEMLGQGKGHFSTPDGFWLYTHISADMAADSSLDNASMDISVPDWTLVRFMSRQEYLSHLIPVIAGYGAIALVALVAVLALYLVGYNARKREREMVGVLNRVNRQLRLEKEEAKRSEQRIETILNTVHDGIITINASGIIENCNDAITAIFGWQQSELLSKNVSVLMPAPFAKMHDRHVHNAVERGFVRPEAMFTELQGRHKDGHVVPVEIMVTAMRINDDTKFVGAVRDISARKEAEKALLRSREQLETVTYFDPLSGLPNRKMFEHHLRRCLAATKRHGGRLAVCYLDLDNFKATNDQLGHEVGDNLLIQVGQRLQSLLREDDTVSRLGGDEYAMLFTGLEDLSECHKVAERVLEGLSEPIQLAGKQWVVTACMGLSVYPDEQGDADTLLRHADHAMYLAKEQGSNRYHIFEADLDQARRSRYEALERIVQGLKQKEFELYYQPKVDLAKGRVKGAEALIRWRHPDFGLLPPAEFLPVIEGQDAAVELDWWVIGEALQQLNLWHQRGLTLQLSVNVSAQILQVPDFVDRLSEMLSHYPDIKTDALELEIVETTALDDLERVSQIIQQCAELDVSFAIDDFGTGYSSLTYFRRLPAKVLKIDQSFVRDMLQDSEDLHIVAGLLSLATAFNREVIAEGVETEEHGTKLLELGCHLGQGYGIARPMPAEALPEWIAAYRQPEAWQRYQLQSRLA